jgi:hypothetical protein
MHTSLILTVIADDKPGIVEKIAEPITAAGANWEHRHLRGRVADSRRRSRPCHGPVCIRSPQQNPRNRPSREVLLHFFGMEVTWK